MWKYLIAFTCLGVATAVQAKDCLFIPGKSICDVPLDSSQERLVEQLGAPDGVIRLGAERTGLMYGSRLMLIYWKKKLWEIHAWDPQLNLSFWEYVRNQTPADPMVLTFKNVVPWGKTRAQMDALKVWPQPIAADAYSDIREIGTTQLTVTYSIDIYASTAPERWEQYRVNSVKVSLWR